MVIDIIKEYEEGQQVLRNQNDQIEAGKLSVMRDGKDASREQIAQNNAGIALLQKAIDQMRLNPLQAIAGDFQTVVKR